MSISFNCLFLVFHYLSLSRFFSFEKKTNRTYLLFFCSLVLCVRVFLKETCVENKREKKGDGIPCMFSFFCLCVYGSRFHCRLFFLWVAAVFRTVFSVFFYAATITAAATVFLYLFIKRLCVCVCQLLLSAVCERAVHSFYFVVLCFFFRLLKTP